MDTVIVDGKVYTKSVKAADEVGYTSDYIGQLCRKGMLEGVMLGKTWYVTAESLLSHKRSQQRVNIATTRRDIEKQKSTLQRKQDSTLYARFPAQGQYRGHLLESRIRYSSDMAELLPQVAMQTPITDADLIPNTQVFKPISDWRDENFVDEEEEIVVPIRKMPQTLDIQPVHPLSTKEVLLKRVIPKRTIHHSLFRVVWVLLLFFVVASITLESTWIYTNSDSQKARLKTAYTFIPMSSITQTVQKLKFSF